jgi:signal transduction histidine kinase
MSLQQVVRLLPVEPHRPVRAATERRITQQKLPYFLGTAGDGPWTPSLASGDVLSAKGRSAPRGRQHSGRPPGPAHVLPADEGLRELAHELSQPLGAIANFARACRQQVTALSGQGRGDVVDSLDQIVEQAERAGQIVRRVRESIRRGDCPRRPVDLNDLIRRLAVMLEVEARAHEVRLELVLGRSLPEAMIDRLQIEQVITNLAHNAMEAAEGVPRARRTVTIRTSLAAENELEVAVEDWGRGLRQEESQRLFEPLESRKADGLGLGLWISRSIVEAHGGRIQAVPNGQQGTTFRFRLPVGNRPGNGAVAKESRGEQ